jgi:hypothetical protein
VRDRVWPGTMCVACLCFADGLATAQHRSLLALLHSDRVARAAARNFSTYSAQEAATSRPHPMPAGQATVGQRRQRAAGLAAGSQVRVGIRTSWPRWATMHRVTRRCSSVGRAAVL